MQIKKKWFLKVCDLTLEKMFKKKVKKCKTKLRNYETLVKKIRKKNYNKKIKNIINLRGEKMFYLGKRNQNTCVL